MICNEVCNEKISSLGLGMMRLPCTDEKKLCIDEAAVEKMIDCAIENGVNYFDTAWIYHGGTSEVVAGKYLKKHKRSSYLLASKFPGMLMEAVNDVPYIFETQMQRCDCGYFDFYLLHNVNDNNIEYYLDDEKYHIVSYYLEQKRKGRIRHLGFSCHASVPVLERFLDKYGELMEFGQLQLNYLDWHLQESEKKYELLKKYNIPVWVMEPLRGGKLVEPDKTVKSELENVRPGYSCMELAFRFLQTLPEVKVVLSGMGDCRQLEENIRIFSQSKPLSETEFSHLVKIADNWSSSLGAPCTGCRYCMEKCPKQLDIPHLLSLYNEHRFSNDSWIARMLIGKMPEEKRPGSCSGCGKCTQVCPQHIDIAGIFKQFAKELAVKKG